jgi:hypothetical protein
MENQSKEEFESHGESNGSAALYMESKALEQESKTDQAQISQATALLSMALYSSFRRKLDRYRSAILGWSTDGLVFPDYIWSISSPEKRYGESLDTARANVDSRKGT